MKKRMIFLTATAILVIGGIIMYRHFILNRVMDKNGMENPFFHEVEPEEIRAVSENAELVEFFWYQNAMSCDGCFIFRINATGQGTLVPRLYCSYMDRKSFERIEIGDEYDSEACPEIPLERWKELFDFLRESELSAYHAPDPNLMDATDSKIQVTWIDGEEQFTSTYDGTSAQELLKLLQDIAAEVY